jgi:hypothetical protein
LNGVTIEEPKKLLSVELDTWVHMASNHGVSTRFG